MAEISIDPRTFVGAAMTLRLTVIGGRTAPGDYLADCQGWTVGRILFNDRTMTPWWSLSLYGPCKPQPEFVPSLHFETLAEAKREMRRQFDAWLTLALAAAERGEPVAWRR